MTRAGAVRRWPRLAVLAACLLIAAACTDRPTPLPSHAPASGPAASAAGTPAPPTPLVGHLSLWHSYGPPGDASASAEVEAFNHVLAWMATTNPGLSIEATFVDAATINARFEHESGLGGGPDLFIASNEDLAAEARAGYLTDLTGRIDATLAGVGDVARAGVTVDGKVFMVPESETGVAMYSDSTKVATPPATTDGLLAFAKGGGRLGIVAGPAFGWGFYGAFGGTIVDPATGACAATGTSGVADALAYVGTLAAQPSTVVTSDAAAVRDAFLAGRLDVVLADNTTLGAFERERPGLAVAAFPTGPSGPGRPLVAETGWSINASSTDAQQDLAIAAAQQLVSAPAEQLMAAAPGHIPTVTTANLADPLARAFAAALATGDPWPAAPQLARSWGPFGDAWARAIPAPGSPAPDIPTLVATACSTMNPTPSVTSNPTPNPTP